jgi:hypothetical protein
MVYRSSVDPEAAARHAEAEEVAMFSRASRVRRRRAAMGVAVAVSSLFMALFLAPAVTPRRLFQHCHRVEIRWENAPEVPGNSWLACEWR